MAPDDKWMDGCMKILPRIPQNTLSFEAALLLSFEAAFLLFFEAALLLFFKAALPRPLKLQMCSRARVFLAIIIGIDHLFTIKSFNHVISLIGIDYLFTIKSFNHVIFSSYVGIYSHCD